MIDANVSKEEYFSRRVDWEEPVYVGWNNAKNYANKNGTVIESRKQIRGRLK